MAITENINPSKVYAAFTSTSCSTTQLLYQVTEDAISGKVNYRLKVDITIGSNTESLYYEPDSSGVITFDIAKAVLAMMTENAQEYSIQMQGLADSYTSNTITTSPDIFAIKAIRQILSDDGANMLPYIAQDDRTPVGKFMTVFEVPRLWTNYDNFTNIIAQDNASIDYDIDYLDINKSVSSSTTDSTTGTTPRIDTLTLPDPPASAEYLRIEASVSASSVSEIKDYKIEPECRNPVMVEWLNSLGVYERWLFQYEQAVTNIADAGISYSSPSLTDIEDSNGNKKRMSANDIQLMTLRAAQLSMNDIMGLHDIKRSDDVRVLIDKTGLSGGISGFADIGGGLLRVSTTAPHLLTDGDTVTITGTTNYNGTYIIQNDPPLASDFDITGTHVGSESGSWTQVIPNAYVNVIVNSAYETTYTTGKSNYDFFLNIEFPDNFNYFNI